LKYSRKSVQSAKWNLKKDEIIPKDLAINSVRKAAKRNTENNRKKKNLSMAAVAAIDSVERVIHKAIDDVYPPGVYYL